MAKKNLFFCFLICVFPLVTGCAKNAINPLQEKYGPDTDYFIGLQELEKNDTKKALRLFTNASKKGTKYVKRRSLEQKILLGNVKQKVKGAKEYLTLYNDDAALIFACKIFSEYEEYAQIIESTNSIDVSSCANELVRMRILAMQMKNDSRLLNTICEWFVSRRIADEHIQFFYNNFSDIIGVSVADLSAANLDSGFSDNFANLLAYICKYRVCVAERNFSIANDFVPFVKEICISEKKIPLTGFLTADLGRCYFSASSRYKENGEYFLDLSKSFEHDKAIKYFSLIYAGRIFDKSGVYISRAEQCFKDAINCAMTDEDYDVALWFLLNTNLSVSTDKCIASLSEYSKSWKNPYYFSDILDNLSLLLFTGAEWESFPEVYKILDGHGDNVSTSKFAFLTGQLINKGYLKHSEEEKIAAFTKAFELNGGTDIYYRLLAAKELNLDAKEIESRIFTPTTALSATNDWEAERLLLGYAEFGFEDLIYPEWQYFYSQNSKIFGIETICQVADFLRSCGNSTNNNYYKSLHMISKTTNLDNSPLNKKVFELSFPKNFSKEISAACQEFEIKEYAMLGLIRTESFFNPIVASHAGAMGLCQIMQATFDDCCARLKIEEAEITDSAINIRVGTYYYSTLVERLDDSNILALFAYNAGITRVRRWLQSSRVGLGLYKNLPSDLFLETIPISETRNYGRKVIQSAAIYAWLYYDTNPCDIVDEMM